MSLKDIRGKDALDLLEVILDPVQNIFGDPEIAAVFRDSTKSKLEQARAVLNTHKDDVIAVLAAVEGVPVDEYQDNLLQMIGKLMTLLNDPDMQFLFPSQRQVTSSSSGAATENTADRGK